MPANRTTAAKSAAGKGINSIKIYDVQGVLRLQQTGNSQHTIQLPINQLTAGFYIVETTIGTEQVRLQLIVQR
jgi:hypothetical protein